jgi:2-polyprenyl-6-methoxyphenol hydroxylase-like FAD-dependent oxidoreductase
VLGVRGQSALQSCDDGQLWAAIAPLCTHISALVEHAGDGSATRRPLPTPAAAVSRSALLAVMLSRLEARMLTLRAEGKNPLLRVRFSTRAIGVDMDDNVLRLATADTPSVGLAFDVLVGADGQDSAVRSALIARPGVNFKQHWVGRMSRAFFVATGTGPGVIPGDSMHTMLPRSLDHIEPPAEIEGADEEEEHEAAPDTRGVLALAASAVFHPRDALRYVMAVPDSVASVTPVHDGFIVELAWSAEAPPVQLAQPKLVPRDKLLDFVTLRFPMLAMVIEEARELQPSPQATRAIYLNSYCDPRHRSVVVIGDAAHAAAPSAGQATAAALSDAAALGLLLSEKADLREAVAMFSDAAVPQGHALVRLSSSLPAYMPLSFPPWMRSLERHGWGAWALLLDALPPKLSARLRGETLEDALFGSFEPYTDVQKRFSVLLSAAMLLNGYRDGAVF